MPVVVALGGIDGCGFGGGARDGCGGGLNFGASWFVEGRSSAVPFTVCGMDGIAAACDVSLPPLSRLNVGTARTGSGTLEAEALGVLWESSSSVSIDGVEARGPCFRCTGSLAVAATGASGLGSGEAKERGSTQLRGG